MRRRPCRVAHNDEIAHVYNVGSVVEVSAAIDRGNVVWRGDVVVRPLGRITDGILVVDEDLCRTNDDRIEFPNPQSTVKATRLINTAPRDQSSTYDQFHGS